MHILYGSDDIDFTQSKTASLYNYDDVSIITRMVHYDKKDIVDNNSYITLMPTDVSTLIAIYGDKYDQQKRCEYIKLLDKFEVSVVKKMSINLDIFFCKKLLKSILNPLMLILGRPNLMKI